jgi:hypothetical protein
MTDHDDNINSQAPIRWQADLPLGRLSADRRILDPDGPFGMREGGGPLLTGPDDGRRLVGRVDACKVDPHRIVMSGVVLDEALATRMFSGELRPAPELDETAVNLGEADGVITFTGGIVRAVTLSESPAWPDAMFRAVGDDDA